MRFTFSLRALLALVLVASLVMAWGVSSARKKARAIARLEELGAAISYDYEWTRSGRYVPNAHHSGVEWLRQVLGEHYADEPVEIQLWKDGPGMKPAEFTDDDAALLAPFEKLEWLVLFDCNLTDAGLDELSRLKSLERLDVEGTRVTAQGVARFRKALPKCRIFWDE